MPSLRDETVMKMNVERKSLRKSVKINSFANTPFTEQILNMLYQNCIKFLSSTGI